MNNYEVILVGFDGSSDNTDHLVFWFKAPSLEAVKTFLGDFPVQSNPTLRVDQRQQYGHEDGTDIILDENGNVVSFFKDDIDYAPEWLELIKEKTQSNNRERVE